MGFLCSNDISDDAEYGRYGWYAGRGRYARNGRKYGKLACEIEQILKE